MYIIREVFTAKPGQASKLAVMFKKWGKGAKFRVMTDMVGNYNTVVMEMEVGSLAEFEKEMQQYRSGEAEKKMSKKDHQEMKKYQEMYLTGRREIYQIVE
ncbi:MAG: hypothetical protein WC570_00300 [Patescibacteria group bacterium]